MNKIQADPLLNGEKLLIDYNCSSVEDPRRLGLIVRCTIIYTPITLINGEGEIDSRKSFFSSVVEESDYPADELIPEFKWASLIEKTLKPIALKYPEKIPYIKQAIREKKSNHQVVIKINN